MTSDFPRRSRNRKLLYLGLIVGLFTVTLFYRPYLLEAHANRLALREQNRGAVDLTGAAVRLSLTGSRGLALCMLWSLAIDKQMKHDWNALEVHVRWITQLEPHFLTPWLFQSWNLAYNVAAESDRVRDKYYYITRGIDLLAEGERQNRDHPDFRFHIAFYYMNKIGIADQHRTLRTLFLMSCLDPRQRDPARLRTPDGQVNLVRFREFCEQQPFLVRRLRELHNCQTPEEVLEFLAENRDVPSRYDDQPLPGSSGTRSRLKPPEQQFPLLPRRADLKNPGHYDYTAETDPLPPDFDNFTAAHVWYTYAQEPLPPPQRLLGPVPVNPDPARYRLPRQPTLLLFRSYPALVQSHLAERRQQDGWFDDGWDIDEGYRGAQRWFAERVVVGNQMWSTRAWQKAYQAWRRHGEESGLLLPPAELAQLQKRAHFYRETFGVGADQLDRSLRPEDFAGALRDSFEAHYQLWWYHEHRRQTNFPRLYAQAEAERTPEAITARALLFQAQRKRRAAEPTEEVLRLYEQAIPQWKTVLNRFPDFRADWFTQEYTYDIQVRYLELLQEKRGSEYRHALALQEALQSRGLDLKQLLLVQDVLGQTAGPAPGAPIPRLPWTAAISGPVIERVRGPFEGNADDGQPFLTEEGMRRARVGVRWRE